MLDLDDKPQEIYISDRNTPLVYQIKTNGMKIKIDIIGKQPIASHCSRPVDVEIKMASNPLGMKGPSTSHSFLQDENN